MYLPSWSLGHLYPILHVAWTIVGVMLIFVVYTYMYVLFVHCEPTIIYCMWCTCAFSFTFTCACMWACTYMYMYALESIDHDMWRYIAIAGFYFYVAQCITKYLQQALELGVASACWGGGRGDFWSAHGQVVNIFGVLRNERERE